MKTQTLTFVRCVAFAIAGLICTAYAAATLLGLDFLPHWLPITGGLGAAVVFSASAMLAGPRNTAASLDESYHADRRSAAVIGFWSAMVTGTGLWLLNIGGNMQLAITMNVAAAMFLLSHVVLEYRGHR
jgi:hypothetical protein